MRVNFIREEDGCWKGWNVGVLRAFEILFKEEIIVIVNLLLIVPISNFYIFEVM